MMIVLIRRIKSFLYYLHNTHYRKLQKSGLFDADYYLRQHHNIDSKRIDPLIHYIKSGWREHKNPNLLFEVAWYSQIYALRNDEEPLLHYIEQGVEYDNNPHPLFFSNYYAQKYPQSVANGQNPLWHYLNIGHKEGNNPNPLFDTAWYLQRYPDVSQLGQNPLYHYYHTGGRELRNPMLFFDAPFYCKRNPGVLREQLSPILHFWQYGDAERQSPNPFFDYKFYQQKYGLEGLSPVELFLHYAHEGWLSNYRPSVLFDSEYYAKTYPESQQGYFHPLEHYQQKGLANGNYPCREMAELPSKPVISILTPVFNTPEVVLRDCIHSVLDQSYPYWELCLVDDGSSKEHIKGLLEEYAAIDTRIRMQFLTNNQGISLSTNQAAELASGEYLAFLDHDDELTQDALYHMAIAINKLDPDVLYSDEDLIGEDGGWRSRFYKPDYNSELLLCHNYVTHFFVTRSTLFLAVGGLSVDCTGAQDYDLMLKLTEQTNKIHHIRRSLYRWRATETSTSINHQQKNYADAAGLKALQRAVKRRGILAEIKSGQWKFFYELRRKVMRHCQIDVLICLTKTDAKARQWLEKLIVDTNYQQIDYYIIYRKAELTLSLPSMLTERVHWVEFAENESQASVFNRVINKTEGEHLIFLRQGVLPQENWVDILLGYSQSEGFGVVGCNVANGSDGQIDDLAVPGLKDLSCQAFRAILTEGSAHLNCILCPQNVIAVSFACCIVARKLFEQAQGFDEVNFPTYLFDIDFCLRLRKLGVEHVFTPFCSARAAIVNDENEPSTDQWLSEKTVFQKKWQKVLEYNPYYNENRLLEEKGLSRQDWINYMAGI